MSLVRKASTAKETVQSLQAVAGGLPKNVARDADAQRKRARTLAKQQQAPDRVASAAGQLVSDVNEAASAAEELKRAATTAPASTRGACAARRWSAA